MIDRLMIILLVLIATGTSTLLNYKLMHSPKVSAWNAARACMDDASGNIKHKPKQKPEVVATHILYCFEKANAQANL